MNAMMLWGPGQPLTMTEVPPVLPPVGDVFVHLKAAALNKRDYWITRGQYPGIVYPLIMGSDGAGLFNEREVIINPGFNWGEHESHFSPGFKILGMPDNGTLSQLVEVPEQNLYDKPGHLNWHETAALPVAGVTAYRGMFSRGQAKANDRLLITGIGGGVATMALLFGKALGMEVWVTSSSDEKIEKAIQLGAAGGVNYALSGWEKTLSEKAAGKFDMVMDGAGGGDFSRIISLLNPGARVIIYGGTAGNIQELSPQRIFWKQINIMGTSMGSPGDFQGMLDFVNLHKIKPVISHTFLLEEANEAIGVIGRNEQFGKVCIDIT